MSAFEIIKTLPGEAQYQLFEELPRLLYDHNSTRFSLGNDPVETHLEGCYVLLINNKPSGRFSFYENLELKFRNKPAACIGSYECIEETEVSKALIKYAVDIAKAKGYTWLIGPMEGSTWNNYRFSLHNEYANFFMEPYHHEYYVNQFRGMGFEVIGEYLSSLDQTLATEMGDLDRFEKRYLDLGAVFRNLNMLDFKNELRKIAILSMDGFANNFLFTPIAVDDFVSKYEKLEHLIDPELIWIVEDAKGEMQAFLFAIKDHCDPSNKTIIVKSIVRKRLSSFKGVGNYLGIKINKVAKQLGYNKVIHALMSRDNISMRLSEKYAGEEYKSYELFGLKI